MLRSEKRLARRPPRAPAGGAGRRRDARSGEPLPPLRRAAGADPLDPPGRRSDVVRGLRELRGQPRRSPGLRAAGGRRGMVVSVDHYSPRLPRVWRGPFGVRGRVPYRFDPLGSRAGQFTRNAMSGSGGSMSKTSSPSRSLSRTRSRPCATSSRRIPSSTSSKALTRPSLRSHSRTIHTVSR